MVKKQLSRFKTVTISVLDKFCNEKDKQYCIAHFLHRSKTFYFAIGEANMIIR